MKDIVFTLEFDDDSANSRANDYLEKVEFIACWHEVN